MRVPAQKIPMVARYLGTALHLLKLFLARNPEVNDYCLDMVSKIHVPQLVSAWKLAHGAVSA